MELAEFARLVRLMRHEQKEFFKTRNPDRLKESKRLERRVDEALVEISNRQQKLFEGE